MTAHGSGRRVPDESGQAALPALGIALVAVLFATVLMAVGQVLVVRAEAQQAADVLVDDLERRGVADPDSDTHALARANGVTGVGVESDDDGTRMLVVAAALPRVFGVRPGDQVRARAELPEWTISTSGGSATGRAYSGPLVAIDGARICPAVGKAYMTMQSAARRDGITLWAVSGWRSEAEQAVLYARLGPRLAAPPGTSLHHAATELDLAVGSSGSPTHGWLTRNGPSFGFIQRYSWSYDGFHSGLPELVIPVRRTACNRLERVDEA